MNGKNLEKCVGKMQVQGSTGICVGKALLPCMSKKGILFSAVFGVDLNISL